MVPALSALILTTLSLINKFAHIIQNSLLVP